MWHLVPWCSWQGVVTSWVQLDLKGLFQPSWFWDSIKSSLYCVLTLRETILLLNSNFRIAANITETLSCGKLEDNFCHREFLCKSYLSGYLFICVYLHTFLSFIKPFNSFLPKDEITKKAMSPFNGNRNSEINSKIFLHFASELCTFHCY